MSLNNVTPRLTDRLELRRPSFEAIWEEKSFELKKDLLTIFFSKTSSCHVLTWPIL
jgi:hypothetical protein